ncbi:MAG: hypothetical protein HFJ57_00250 [Clostridia bacterium]|nr:hypothetical protein [Clostridia bacterium]
MIKVTNLQPIYGLRKKTFVRPNMMLEEDILSIVRAIRASEDDIRNGRVYDGIEVLKELREQYGY